MLLALLLLPATAAGYDFEVDGIYYNINGNEATVTRGPGYYSGDVTIPETVTYNRVTRAVTAIGDEAFWAVCRTYWRALALDSVNKFSRQDDVVLVDGGGKQGGNLLIPKASDAAADAGHEELELRMRLGEGDELVNIGLDGLHTTLHRGDGITLSLQPHTLTPHGAKAVIGGTSSPTAVHSAQVAAKDEDFIILQCRDHVRRVFSFIHIDCLIRLIC